MDATLEVLSRVLVLALAMGTVMVIGILGAHPKADRRGWRQVKAGAMHWTGLGLGAALTGLLSYIWLFVGSSRADADSQMRILFFLIVVFGLGTIVAGLQTLKVLKRAVHWRGNTIRFTSRATAQTREFQDVREIRRTAWGRVVLHFNDGTELTLDPTARGASSLIDKVTELINPQIDETKG